MLNLLLSPRSQHVPHREPAAPAVQPARGLQRAAREHRAIARRVRQRDRLRRGVEADRMRAGDRAGARRRHVDRLRCTRARASPLRAPAPYPTARPSSPRDAARAATRRTPAGRATTRRRARSGPGTGSRRSRSSARRRTPMPRASASARSRGFLRLPSRRADDDVHPARRQPRKVRRHRLGQREIDRHVGRRPRLGLIGVVHVHRAGDLEAVLGRSASTSRPILPRPTISSEALTTPDRARRCAARPRARRTDRAGGSSPRPPPNPAARP